MSNEEKKSSGAGKFFLGAALGAIAGAIAGKFISSAKTEEYDEADYGCDCDDTCECDKNCECKKDESAKKQKK